MTDTRRTLLDAVREQLALRHASPRTVEAYTMWVRRFIRFNGGRHPRQMAGREVTAFLSHLATDRRVASSTQNQALAALPFLYGPVLETPVGWLDGLVHAKRPHRVPTVLTRAEARAVLETMSGVPQLVAMLLYSAGLRLLEACALRVKDVDLTRREVVVRQGKGVLATVTDHPGSRLTHQPGLSLTHQAGRTVEYPRRRPPRP